MILQSIRYGWNKARLWVWAFLPAVLLQWVLNVAVTWREGAEGGRSLHLWWHDMGPQGQGIVIAAVVLGIMGYIVSAWIRMGIINGSVKAARGEDVTAGDFFLKWENVEWFILGTLLYGLIVSVGMVLLVVPGIIWALRYCMYGHYMVTQGAGPVEALQMSAAATDGHKGELFGLKLASMGVIILGTLCLGVGLVWAIPTVEIAWSAVFLRLSGQQMVRATELA
ncbi:DUF975 family protein [Candidatus Cryosericum septentrionale]|jgi:uncharacterized membrane protein|uniref:DUF975 family protein n=1 Tax=Candidatus Cryosericum septentrionale TaxID=2290913 RepID=A0A398DWT6_9BACT|nr:DUF975 family protein [Candidatus Cryosericum septentrionale]RIE15774.1 DUF975 family protein [Candidatus Cryosericum septentrionale]